MDYYVYLYWRLDTNEPFYVGKGCNDRWKKLNREYNKHFTSIVNNIPIAVTIEKENLTEDEAFYWEEEIIRQLVFEYGFSIDIKGANSNDHYCHLVNQTWGGEGTSGHNPYENKTEEERDEWCKKISEVQKNIQNKAEIKKKKSERMSGKNNPNYGKKMSIEATQKMSENHWDCSGKNNPMYGISLYGEKNGMYGKNHTKESIRKMETSVICLTTKKIFYGIKEAGRFYEIKSYSHISSCCNGDRKSCGKYNGTPLVWRRLIWKHNKKLRPLNK